jgi:hypothetical protein
MAFEDEDGVMAIDGDFETAVGLGITEDFAALLGDLDLGDGFAVLLLI